MFKFPLQRLLKLKAMREQEKARQLAVAQRDAAVEEQHRADIAALQSKGTEQVAAGADASPSVGELVSMRHALTQMGEQLVAAQERAAAALEVVATRNEELSDAVQERQVLDRLRDRRMEEHRAATHHQERTAMDAVALARFHATRSGDHETTKG